MASSVGLTTRAHPSRNRRSSDFGPYRSRTSAGEVRSTRRSLECPSGLATQRRRAGATPAVPWPEKTMGPEDGVVPWLHVSRRCSPSSHPCFGGSEVCPLGSRFIVPGFELRFSMTVYSFGPYDQDRGEEATKSPGEGREQPIDRRAEGADA